MEQSTNNFPLTFPLSTVAIVSLTAGSSPRHVKMMSDFDTASSMLETTVAFPDGSFSFNSVARLVVRLYMIRGLSRLPFSTRFLHMPYTL